MGQDITGLFNPNFNPIFGGMGCDWQSKQKIGFGI